MNKVGDQRHITIEQMIVTKNEKVKDTEKCVVNRKLKFEDYNHFLESTQLENKINQLEKINLMWIVLENHK